MKLVAEDGHLPRRIPGVALQQQHAPGLLGVVVADHQALAVLHLDIIGIAGIEHGHDAQETVLGQRLILAMHAQGGREALGLRVAARVELLREDGRALAVVEIDDAAEHLQEDPVVFPQPAEFGIAGDIVVGDQRGASDASCRMLTTPWSS